MTVVTPKKRCSKTHNLGVPEMAVGPNIWEIWNRISYQVFEAIALDEQRLTQHDPTRNLQNTWLCVPQLISNLVCLTSASLPGPSDALRRELLSQNVGAGGTSMQRVVMNLIGDELRQWENALHATAKPGIFTVARRIMVHPKFTKSYAYNTFVTLNSIGVEMKIFDGPSEIVQWIQKNLKLNTIQQCPFEMWKGGDTRIKKEVLKETGNRDLLSTKSNQRCPIFVWASHYQIAFKSGIFESEVVFTASGTRDCIGEEMYARFHNEKPKMRYCSAGRSGILEVPTNSSSIFLYFITDIERSITGPQLLDMIKEVQKITPDTHTAYIPIWWPHNQVSNVAKGIKISLDAEPLFSHGGFGDLAMEDAEPSAEYSKKFTSNIQHFDMVTVFHTPDTSKRLGRKNSEIPPIHILRRFRQRLVLDAPPFNTALIKCPFTLIIFDEKKRMPVYYGRIVNSKVIDMKTSNTGENDDNKPKQKKWCKIM